ncbi:MAG TPA: hypothetical protein VFV99_32325 [Kofleriaceae bacterium]|nr:hypothetical protein [Kofleriaceae bacterium]
MKHLALAFLVLAACTDDQPDPTPHDIGKTVVEMCGQPPLAPGWQVQSNGGVVTMSTDEYNAIVKYRDDSAAWRECAIAIP